jgi:hypothetical protein
MKRYTAASVLATEWSMDISDINEYRYHYGMTTKPVYSIDNAYYCATRKGQKPAKHRSIEFEWKEHSSKFADSINWQIWVADSK